MSHVTKISVEIKNLDALSKACEELGLQLNIGQTKFRWYAGNQGNCLHAITIPGNTSAYEIGVQRNGDGFRLETDFYAGGKGLVAKVGNKAEKLIEEYTAQVTIQSVEEMGFEVAGRELTGDGTIQLEFVQY